MPSSAPAHRIGPPALGTIPAHPPARAVRSAVAGGHRSAGGRVVVLGASVGQGHDGAARELARRLSGTRVDVAVHDYLDALPVVVRRALRDLYAPTVQYLPAVFDGMFRRLLPHGQPDAG